MEKNESAAPAKKGGKTTKQDGPAAGDQAQQDNQGVGQLQVGSTNVGDQQAAPASQPAGDQSGPIEVDATGESVGSSIASSIESIRCLEVTSLQAGFRRAGRAWSTTPTVVKLSDLDEAQFRQIVDEPMLKVKGVILPTEDA